MIVVPVSSSQIAAVGYDAATCELIRFHGSGRAEPAIYSYAGVPADLAHGLVALKPGCLFPPAYPPRRFPYRRVERGEPGYLRREAQS